MLALYRTLSLRYLRQRWGLNALVVLSIGLGVSIWVATSAEILTLLRGLPEAGKRAVVMVTHDPGAAAYGDRLILIRDGLVEEDRRQEPSGNGAPATEGIQQARGAWR